MKTGSHPHARREVKTGRSKPVHRTPPPPAALERQCDFCGGPLPIEEVPATQRYCSAECRYYGRQAKKAEAKRRYRRSPRGLDKNRADQVARRIRKTVCELIAVLPLRTWKQPADHHEESLSDVTRLIEDEGASPNARTAATRLFRDLRFLNPSDPRALEFFMRSIQVRVDLGAEGSDVPLLFRLLGLLERYYRSKADIFRYGRAITIRGNLQRIVSVRSTTRRDRHGLCGRRRRGRQGERYAA